MVFIIFAALKRYSPVPAFVRTCPVRSLCGLQIANCWCCVPVPKCSYKKTTIPERAIAVIISKVWEVGWHLWLGRNAAIYPSEEVTAEGETVARSFSNFGLCRKIRRKHKDSGERSRQIMMRWLNSSSDGMRLEQAGTLTSKVAYTGPPGTDWPRRISRWLGS